jgi:adenylosuccinate synthase
MLKICTGYRLNGKTIDYFPASIADLERCQPIYEKLPGWQTETSHVREFAKLPAEARIYINRLEELSCCPANIICVGPSREQSIQVRPVI